MAVLWPAAASADVTADDVLSNLLAPVRALGVEVSVAPVREGRRLYASKMAMRYALPMQLGELRIRSGDLVLDEQDDGSVTIRYREPFKTTLEVFTPEDGTVFTAVAEYEGFDTPTVARGAPGRIAYEAVYEDARFSVVSVNFSEQADVEIAFDGSFTGRNRYEITEGEIVRVFLTGENGEMRFTSRTRDMAGTVSTGEQMLTGGSSRMELAIPAGKVDLMTLHAALAAGLRMSVTSEGGQLAGTTLTETDTFTMRQTMSYLMEKSALSMDAGGVMLAAVARDVAFEYLFPPDLPFPIAGKAARSEGRMRLPVTKTGGAVPVAYRVSMEALELDEAIWALFDPEARLPRDPMTVVLGLSGEAAFLRDPLNIPQMMEVDLREAPLGTVERVVLDEFLLRAAGMEMTGAGAFEIDNEDYQTFPGMPAPSGRVDLQVRGANRLVDTLAEMGLLPEDQAMGVRMMIAMFGVPGAGQDEVTSTIEITEEGAVLANGQRLR